MKIGHLYLPSVISILFLLSCAKQTTPTGGPKDTIPPSLISSKPFHQQTKFTHTTIELNFNEPILLNNPKEQILITPDTQNPFETQVKKNTATIKFETPFLPNTTYAINFRDAIQDITEKNPTENLKLAFSTGEYIDSLKIEGSVTDLLKSQELQDATVALYQKDTFNIFQHKPTYFTKTDKEGKFQLTNLKPGDYYIYAVDDKNKNLIVESKSEAYGFQAKPLHVHQNIQDQTVSLIRLDTRPLKLTSARPTGTYFNIKTSKNLSYYRIIPQPDHLIQSSYGEDHANIKVYNTIHLKDSALIRFIARDSLSNTIDTLFYLKFLTRNSTPEEFTASTTKFRVIESKGTLEGKINFNKPLRKINFDTIQYQIDSTKILYISPEDIIIDSANNSLSIHKTFSKFLLTKTSPEQPTIPVPIQPTNTKQNKDNRIYIAKNTFISVEYDSSLAISTKVEPTLLENTGMIITNVKIKSSHYIVELLTKDFQIVHASFNNPRPTFEDLEPGDYRLRLIVDEDQDGKWTPGNFLKRQEPEKIIYYKNQKQNPIISLKANWELGPLLITY